MKSIDHCSFGRAASVACAAAEALGAVQPVEAFPVHRPPFPPKQDVAAGIAVADARRGDPVDPQPQERLFVAARTVALRRAVET